MFFAKDSTELHQRCSIYNFVTRFEKIYLDFLLHDMPEMSHKHIAEKKKYRQKERSMTTPRLKIKTRIALIIEKNYD